MTRKHLRSRKQLNKHIILSRIKDRDAIETIADLGTSMLTVCRENDVEPETMLYECALLTKIAQSEMMRKYETKFQNRDGSPWSKEQRKMIFDDLDRLWKVLNEQCIHALRDADWKIEHMAEVECIGTGRKDNDRPIYIN